MVSPSAEGMVVSQQLQHAAQLINYSIDSNGQLSKRKGIVVADKQSTVTNYPLPLTDTQHIIFSRVLTSSYSDVVIDFFVRDTSLTTNAISQYTAFFSLPDFQLTQLIKREAATVEGLVTPNSFFEVVTI